MNKIIDKIYRELINTGERPITHTLFEDIEPVLQFAYKFASERIKENDCVLDYGCGGGYGTEYLARYTKGQVIGFDIDRRTVRENSQFYIEKINLQFAIARKRLDKYDVVTSFQVIEHLPDGHIEEYLKNLKKYTKDDGTFLLATVNKNITSYLLKKPIMPFHIHEFYPHELIELLGKYFEHVECFGQIDGQTRKRMERGWTYREKSKRMKDRILVAISQCEFVRWTARHLPLFIKRIFFGESKKDNLSVEYHLTSKKEEIDNSYILLYECRNHQ